MNRRHASLGHAPAHEALAPYRILAARVIGLAMRDLLTCGQASADGNSARAFLAGSPMLTHWCEVAEIDPAAVRAQLRRFVAQGAISTAPESES